MLGTDGITREEQHNNLLLGVDLDYMDTLIGKRAPMLGIPLFRTQEYSPPPDTADTYHGLRRWYRTNLEKYSGLFIIHHSDLQRSLSKAQPDAIEYLIIEDEEERNKHEGWKEPENEAVEIEQWIFPANAVNRATVSLDFNFENIKVTIYKNSITVAEIYYFVNQKERAIFYSNLKKLKAQA
jgi:hypothetical protein